MAGLALMVQGTGSNVGKSLVVAGLCRHFTNQGFRVRPFKPQNMSNNAAVTTDGGEIGRAQEVQALACKVEPSVHMNPLLLKPETDIGAQIILQGKFFGTMHATEFGKLKSELMPKIVESFNLVRNDSDLVIVEGAGSVAETNLRQNDMANMGFAELVNIPAIIVGDIDKGGVIASLIGTHVVLDSLDQQRIKAFLINRFRGDQSLFRYGLNEIEQRTNWQSVGILPWFNNAHKLPAEDALDLDYGRSNVDEKTKIAVPVLSRIANFDDLDPLKLEESVDLVLVQPGKPIPGDAKLVIIPGTKSTIGDLKFFRNQGWDIDLSAHLRRGGYVLGLCGGFQMLGEQISDPKGIEGRAETVTGLGHLRVNTELDSNKTLTQCVGIHIETETEISGYEIHLGLSSGEDCDSPFIKLANKTDGATSPNGKVFGTYLHGLFTSDEFRTAFLKNLGIKSDLTYKTMIDDTLDELAEHLNGNLDTNLILKLASIS